ncbi:MAG: hypothetical protein ACI8RZ_007253 [Myxococcota bacterium]|jgi:hypothetical protein
MFGTLRPHGCSLPTVDRQQHRHLYCGLCKTMGADYGTLTRPLVSVDAVLLGVVVDALQEDAAPQSSCRCPIAPHRFRTTIDHDSTTMRFSAAAQVLLTDQWLADRAMDGRTLARIARPLGGTTVQRAWEVLDSLGADLSGLIGLERRQVAVEAAGVTEEASLPSESAVALVFSQIPQLPGCAALTDDEEDALTGLGAALGAVVYGVDALEDLEEDLLSDAFNPCLRDGVVDRERLEATAAMVQDSLAAIRRCLDALPLRRHEALLENILIDRQSRKADKAAAAARTFADSTAPPVARWRRNLTALWAMLTALWGMVSMGGEGEGEDEKRRRSGCFDCGSGCDGTGCECCCESCDCLTRDRGEGGGCEVCDSGCGGCDACDGGCCDVCDCCSGCDCGC